MFHFDAIKTMTLFQPYYCNLIQISGGGGGGKFLYLPWCMWNTHYHFDHIEENQLLQTYHVQLLKPSQFFLVFHQGKWLPIDFCHLFRQIILEHWVIPKKNVYKLSVELNERN
jgi:hypothetical protein